MRNVQWSFWKYNVQMFTLLFTVRWPNEGIFFIKIVESIGAESYTCCHRIITIALNHTAPHLLKTHQNGKQMSCEDYASSLIYLQSELTFFALCISIQNQICLKCVKNTCLCKIKRMAFQLLKTTFDFTHCVFISFIVCTRRTSTILYMYEYLLLGQSARCSNFFNVNSFWKEVFQFWT